MKRFLSFAIAAVLLASSGLTVASPQDEHDHGYDKHGDRDDHGYDKHADRDDHGHNPKDEGRHDNGEHKGWYKKGDRLPDQYYGREYYVTDYDRYHLRRPEPGYRWVRAEGGQFYLTLISNGVIIDVATGF
ncbi:RcnB family protein [Dyella silvae]|uniref:RcnB family protein n=1 Tax=Dyella silvae TaxID=2994424 RepID=UPI002263F9E6|nr:RcnB family protein [Dyella silvae]